MSHQLLPIKLGHYGIRGSTLRWINPFLSERTQKAILEGAVSDTVKITSGVSQGSVLGPILFLLYINDLPNSLSSKVRLFADDAIVYREINLLQNCLELQNDLNKLMAWEFNPSKCEILSVTRKKSATAYDYTLHGHTLNRVKSTKYLGLTITSDLNWKKAH